MGQTLWTHVGRKEEHRAHQAWSISEEDNGARECFTQALWEDGSKRLRKGSSERRWTKNRARCKSES